MEETSEREGCHGARGSVSLRAAVVLGAAVAAVVLAAFFPRPAPQPSPSAPPPAAAPARGFRPEPGEQVAAGVVGPAGGTVEAAGQVSVLFPAGALTRDERVVIRKEKAPSKLGAFFFVDREGGAAPLGAPARITFAVAPGVDAGQLLAMRQLDAAMFVSTPFTYDPAARTLSMEVPHFSAAGWLNATSLAALVGAAVGAFTGAVTVLVVTGAAAATAAVGAPVVLALGASALVGAAIANPVYDQWKQKGLAAALPVVGFDLLWNPASLPRDPCVILYQGADGKLACVQKVGARDAQGQPVPPTVLQGSTSAPFKYMQAVPLNVFDLAGVLQYSRAWYRASGFSLPEKVTVLLRDDLGATSSGGGEQNAGEWDGRVFNLNVGLVASDAEDKRAELDATVPHELWHAVFTHNGYQETFAGLDDCYATTFESLIAADSKLYRARYGWTAFAPVIANGLLGAGPDEGFTQPGDRGYALWPWGKFLYHRQGPEEMRALASGSMDRKLLDALFVTFSRSLVTMSDALAAAEAAALPDGSTQEVATGWGELDLAAMIHAMQGKESLPLGRQEDRIGRYALAMHFMRVALPQREPGQPPGTLVVRREVPNDEDEVVALPALSGTVKVEPVATADELAVGRATLTLPKADDEKGEVLRPLVVVGRSSASPSVERNGLLLYRLAPPKDLRTTQGPPDSSGAAQVELEWKVPDLGLRPSECLAGYRLYGRSPGRGESVLTELLFGKVPRPPGLEERWYAPTGKHVELLPDAERAVVPAALTAPWAELGMASIDGVVREGDGPMLSETAWSKAASVRIGRPIAEVEQGVIKASYAFRARPTNLPADTSYAWNFGDGGVARGEQATHAYGAAGTYKVRLEATCSNGSLYDETTMVIAPDTAEAKAEVTFLVRRRYKNRMGTTKQACNLFHVQILRGGVVVDGGDSVGQNGAYSLTLPVGSYSYKVAYKYTTPPDSGTAAANFSVAVNGRNAVEIETPPYEAFD